ncbi:HIT family protein [Sinimarinibacterium thermocellulolyticum]|uniref:HIT family protein n=1 Tax=Sinimarinibacterium thermocellulolyticum TaxID=3170016 RepID=A0ABV2ADI2_9GAMM
MRLGFELDPRLAADTLPVGDGPLCRVLLMNDQRYPWVILVPRVAGVTELYQLTSAQQRQLLDESMRLGERLMAHFAGHKLNVAALGNVVAQLHVHHIVRYRDDAAWPAPVWGRHPPQPYGAEGAQARVAELRRLLDLG